MQTIIAAIIFGLILITAFVMIVIYLSYKGIRKLKQEAEENYYRNQKRKEQKEKYPFGEDYFKGKQQEQPKTDNKNTARRTTTSSGVTIIDDRDSEEKRKIFDHSDGEYVEFEEV